MRLTAQEHKHLRSLLKTYLADRRVQQMRNYIQHGSVSTYAHCRNVVQASYLLNRRLHLGADEKALVTGALLHDFYLYDWHQKDDGTHRFHGFTHPARACLNACKHFQIGQKEQDIISSHMWPLTFRHIPKSKEAAIVCLTDKYCSLKETLFYRKK